MQRIQGELCEKAGAGPSKIKYLEDLLDAITSSKRRALLRWPLPALLSEGNEKMGVHQGWAVCADQLASLVESE